MRRAGRWLLSADGLLRERILRAAFWLFLGNAFARVAGFIKLAVLARLLAPGDFGLMGVALVVLRWVDYFTQTGFRDALIQKPGDVRPYLDTAWTVQVLRGTAVSAVLFAAAPLAAWFFENEQAAPVVRAVSVTIFLAGLINPAVVLFRKNLDFQRDVVWRLGGSVPGLVVGVIAALAWRNVWALVLSVVVAGAAQTALSYWID